MPLYEYECSKCRRRFERIEKVTGPHMKKCPQCRGRVERLLAPPAIQFKGSGWYVTDYAAKGAAKSEAEKAAPADKAEKAEKPEKKDAAKREKKEAPKAKEKH